MTIKNTTFQKNQAPIGGAVAFECTSITNCNLVIEDSTFSDNKATTQGGAIYYDYNYPSIMNTTFTNNTASYGPNLASYAARIGMMGSTPDDIIQIEDIGSGVTIGEPLKLALFDLDNQILNLDQSSQIIIVARNQTKASIKGTNIDSVSSGISEFDSIAPVIDLDYREANYIVNSKALDMTKIKDVLGSTYEQKDLIIKFRDCQPGERILGNE